MQQGAMHMRRIFLALTVCLSTISVAQAGTWGAVTIANDGWTKASWNYPTKEAAIEASVSTCKSDSSLPNSCQSAWAPDDTWASAIQCVNAKGDRWGVL